MKALNYIQEILTTVKLLIQQFLYSIKYHKTGFMSWLLSYPVRELISNNEFSHTKNKDFTIKDYCGRSGFIAIMAPVIAFAGAYPEDT